MKRLKWLNEYLKTLQFESGRVLPVLLVILLLLAAGGYLFFNTGLFAKHDQGNTLPAPNASLVKKPLPPSLENTAVVQEKSTNVKQQHAQIDSKTKTGVEKPAPVKSSEQKKLPVAKSTGKKLPAPKNPEEQLAKLTTEKPPAKSASVPKKTVSTEQNKKAKEPVKKQAVAKASKNSNVASVVTEKGKYTLLIGVYVMKKSMAPEKTKLKSAGLKPAITAGPKKMETMNRLFVGRFDSYAEASLASKKLAKATKDTFILHEKDKFSVYAGSYFEQERAISEHERLAKSGLKSEIVQTSVPVNTFRLTAGSFLTKELAAKESKRLKKLGLSATVASSGI